MYKLYALLDRKDAIEKKNYKYIGVTKNSLLVRLGQHLNKIYERKTRRDKWIIELDDAPRIVLLAEFKTSSECLAQERKLINEFENEGIVLLNEAGNRFKNDNHLKKMSMYDKNGNHIFTGSCIKIQMAFPELNLSYKPMNACCNKSKKSYRGFFFSFQKLKNYKPEFATYAEKYKNCKTVYRYDMNGNYIDEFVTHVKAGEAVGAAGGEIWKACNTLKTKKRVLSVKGYKFSYNKGEMYSPS